MQVPKTLPSREDQIAMLNRYGVVGIHHWEDTSLKVLYKQLLGVLPSWINTLDQCWNNWELGPMLLDLIGRPCGGTGAGENVRITIGNFTYIEHAEGEICPHYRNIVS